MAATSPTAAAAAAAAAVVYTKTPSDDTAAEAKIKRISDRDRDRRPAPSILLKDQPPEDRGGLTVEQWDEINVFWEDESKRNSAYHALVSPAINLILLELTDTVMPVPVVQLICAYTSPEQLPPALLLRLSTKREIDNQLKNLRVLEVQIGTQIAAQKADAERELAAKLKRRTELRARYAHLERRRLQALIDRASAVEDGVSGSALTPDDADAHIDGLEDGEYDAADFDAAAAAAEPEADVTTGESSQAGATPK